MKKRITLIILALCCMLVLSACGCKHETWLDANCTTPKTCESCSETEGSPLGHTWLAAACETPKTCETCGETEGEALGHSWNDATCVAPKTCASCGLTEGEALGHSWVDATTEAPKTCETCGETEGERIMTDERFSTEESSIVFGKWACEMSIPGSELGNGLDAYVEEFPCIMYVEFTETGDMVLYVEPTDEALVADVMYRYTVDLMYEEFTSMGMTKEEADAAMLEVYGMSIQDYVTEAIEQMDLTDIFSSFTATYVYYVEGDQMYLGFSWNGEMTPGEFSVEGDTLYLPLEDGSPTSFTRVTE